MFVISLSSNISFLLFLLEDTDSCLVMLSLFTDKQQKSFLSAATEKRRNQIEGSGVGVREAALKGQRSLPMTTEF